MSSLLEGPNLTVGSVVVVGVRLPYFCDGVGGFKVYLGWMWPLSVGSG